SANSPYFSSSSSSSKPNKPSEPEVEISSFFGTSKIHQSEKVVKPPAPAKPTEPKTPVSTKPVELKKAKSAKSTQLAKKPSIAKPDKDDEFADFDFDASQLDLRVLDSVNSTVIDLKPDTGQYFSVSDSFVAIKLYATPTKIATEILSEHAKITAETSKESAKISQQLSSESTKISTEGAPSTEPKDLTKISKNNSKLAASVATTKITPVPKSKKRATVFIDDDDDGDDFQKVTRPVKKSTANASLKSSPAKFAKEVSETDACKILPVKNKHVEQSGPAPLQKEKLPSEKNIVVESTKKANYLNYLAKKVSNVGPSALGSKDIPVGEQNCLMGLAFVFTGDLSSITRDEAQDLVKRYGGRVTGAISGKTSYVVVGEGAGQSKLTKAASLKVKSLDEDQFFDLIRSSKGKPDPSSTSSKSPAAPKKSTSSVAAPTTKVPLAIASSSSFHGFASDSKGKTPTYASYENKQQKREKPTSSELWTSRYKPKRYEDVMGNKKNVEKLATWLRTWDASLATPKPSTSKDDPGKSRAILISGPPGIGKTTAAHLVAHIEGFEMVEFNASDTRSKKSVGDIVKEMTGMYTLSGYFQKKSGTNNFKRQVLIMDEVDGMSAGDRGGIAELINIIKSSKIPIICVCNDRQSPKVKSLVNHCFDMRFARPKTLEIEKTIKNIAEKEGLTLKFNVVDTLVKSTHSDIRQILNILSAYSLSETELDFDQSQVLIAKTRSSKSSEKNMTMSPFDIAATLLNRGSFRDASFADKLELYFHDFSLIPLMIQENYIKMDPSLAHENSGPSKEEKDVETLMCLSQAADSIAYADIISSVQMKTQNWGLLPFHGVTSTLRPAFFTHGTVVAANYFGAFGFPGWLGKNSTQGKNARLLKE
ncbi:hypothetical protein HK100_007035, partial [Physocladia obscura]